MTDEYRQGADADLLVQFYAYAGGPAAGVSGLTITISPAGGGAAVLGPTSVGVTNESTGLYSYTWAVPAAQATGLYVVEWNATGGITAAETIRVIDGWANAYITLDLLKDALKISDSDRDDLLNQARATASRRIDAHTGRRFYADSSASARTWATRGRVVPDRTGEQLLADDISSLTGLVVEGGDGSTWSAVTDYFTEPDNALARGEPITGLRYDLGRWSGHRRVRVTARWGWPAVPDQVIQATLIQAARLFRRKDSPEGLAGSAEFGLVRLSRMDPDVQALLQHLVLPGIA